MTALQILGVIVFVVGLASIAVRLLLWAFDLDIYFRFIDDGESYLEDRD